MADDDKQQTPGSGSGGSSGGRLPPPRQDRPNMSPDEKKGSDPDSEKRSR